ncbi:MAG: hypothetical protein LBH01_02375 [Verrucomicrobiales bacterium]|jgi:hypothetical protein|nr:hypothetical protein [Verrucomicrobiales bacterium]
MRQFDDTRRLGLELAGHLNEKFAPLAWHADHSSQTNSSTRAFWDFELVLSCSDKITERKLLNHSLSEFFRQQNSAPNGFDYSRVWFTLEPENLLKIYYRSTQKLLTAEEQEIVRDEQFKEFIDRVIRELDRLEDRNDLMGYNIGKFNAKPRGQSFGLECWQTNETIMEANIRNWVTPLIANTPFSYEIRNFMTDIEGNSVQAELYFWEQAT